MSGRSATSTRCAGRSLAAILVLCAVGAGAGAELEPTTDLIRLEEPGEIGNLIRLDMGRSQLIRTPWTVDRLAVGDPEVADVQILETNEILLVAKGPGTTDLMIWSSAGDLWQARVLVEVNLQALNDRLARLFPRAGLEVTQTEEVYFVTGTLESADQAAQLHGFLEASGLSFVDMTKLAGVPQVQIQVRVAEVNRVAIRRLSVNILGVDDDYFAVSRIGPAVGGAVTTIPILPPEGAAAAPDIPFLFGPSSFSPLVTLFAGFPGSDLELFLQALSENQYLRILAEPNLVALSGEEATFLAGGEFPVPVVQGTATGSALAVTIEWKEFGVRLRFRPTVLGEGGIRLSVAPEVSELSDLGAVEIQGFRVPTVLTRRSETTLQLNSGQTFAMAGLLNQTTNARNSRTPVLGDLPVLGTLFRSVSYQSGESELVILVTATVVEPLDLAGKAPVPGDDHVEPNDWELFLLGRLSGAKAGANAPQAVESVDVDEPNLSQLKGPGAWARYVPGG